MFHWSKLYWGYVAGIFLLLQSIPHLLLFYYFSFSNSCIGTQGSTAALVYMTYIYNATSCQKKYVNDFLDKSIKLDNLIELPHTSRFYRLTYKVIMCHVFLDSMLIASSVGLLMGSCMGSKTRGALLLFYPWISVSIAAIALDIVSSSFYGSHVKRINKSHHWLKLIGVNISKPIEEEFNRKIKLTLAREVPTYTALVFSRGSAVLLLNVLLTIRVILTLKTVYKACAV